MRKTIFFAVSLFAILFCACQKDSDLYTFKAVMEKPTHDGKTSITQNGSNYDLNWQAGDSILINNGSTWGRFGCLNITGGSAIFQYDVQGSGAETFFNSATSYKAYYPNTLVKSDGSTVIPGEQHYIANQMDGFPMYAEVSSTSDELEFHNICGALKICISGGSYSNIERIQLIADQPMSGEFHLSTDKSTAVINTGVVNEGVSLVFDAPRTIQNGDVFYIYLPANTYTNMKILFHDNAGGYYEKSSGTDVTIERNTISSATFGATKAYKKTVLDFEAFCNDYVWVYDLEEVHFVYGSSLGTSGEDISVDGSSDHIYAVLSDNDTKLTVYTSSYLISSNDNSFQALFMNLGNLDGLSVVDFGYGYSTYNVTDINCLFEDCGSLQSVYLGRAFNLNVAGFEDDGFNDVFNGVSNCTVTCTQATKDALTSNSQSRATNVTFHVI